MYTVYLGLQDKSTIDSSNISPAVKMSVAIVKRVKIKINYQISVKLKSFLFLSMKIFLQLTRDQHIMI